MREFDLLRDVFRHNSRLPSFVAIPPGDDMALVRLAQPELLVAADQVIEGRHVVRGEDPALIGRKAVARNVSDVAAMAGRPLATLATIALPRGYGDERARGLLEGLRGTAEVFGCPLVGGDVAFLDDASPSVVCTVTILATPAWPGARVVTREGARAGDGVYVSGRLGGSVDADGGGRHLTFDPRVDEAIALLELLGDDLHSMIDISDGLGRDAAHLVELGAASGLAIEIDAARVPATAGVPWRRAIGDGEDYELLFTCAGPVPSRVGRVELTRIGTVRARAPGAPPVVALDGAERIDVSRLGWEHAG
ncbi:MAG: thiamine-phosphate kinase [Phycisphaerales bacterium]